MFPPLSMGKMSRALGQKRSGWIFHCSVVRIPPTLGEHIQHDDDQLSEGGRAERHAVVGHLLHILRLRSPLRVRSHPSPDEGMKKAEI